MTKSLTIGRIARLAEVNVQTVRYYERRGLLTPVGRKASGYRVYDEGALKRLKFIRRAKDLGFTLDEIKGLLDLKVEDPLSCVTVQEKALEKLKTVEEKIHDLDAVRKVLRELVDSCSKRRATDECPILNAMEGE